MRRFWATVIATAASSYVATAADISTLPRLDPESQCDSSAKGNVTSFNYCIKYNQEHYDLLKQVWRLIPQDIVDTCISDAEYRREMGRGPVTYMGIFFCVDRNMKYREEDLNVQKERDEMSSSRHKFRY